MSLLKRGPGYEPCTVFPEECVIDREGNERTRPSKTGIPATARFQVQGQSGTSSRRAEQDNEGFESEKVYRIQFPQSWTDAHGIQGAQAELEWRGERWTFFGDVNRYTGSRRTAHVEYTIKRY